MIKRAMDERQAWDIQETYEDEPHGWIQWKGTDVCMDVYCVCGETSHYDGGFCYYVRCPNCGRIYFCNGHIEFIQIVEQEPSNCVQKAYLYPHFETFEEVA